MAVLQQLSVSDANLMQSVLTAEQTPPTLLIAMLCTLRGK